VKRSPESRNADKADAAHAEEERQIGRMADHISAMKTQAWKEWTR
jgi:hypothetical protein